MGQQAQSTLPGTGSLAAIGLAAGSGPVPGPAKLATAVHGALAAPPVEGVSATVTLTDHLVEGANLASGGGEAGQLSSSPLLSGASGRLWIAKDGRARLELLLFELKCVDLLSNL